MIQKTNSRSCVIDAAAQASGLSAGWLMGQIGHNGVASGFHTPDTGEVTVCTFGLVSPEERFIDALVKSDGVLLGLNHKLKPHAVSWKQRIAHDPATGTTFELLQQNSDCCFRILESEGLFMPSQLLRLTEIV
jgi:hypothetical protein